MKIIYFVSVTHEAQSSKPCQGLMCNTLDNVLYYYKIHKNNKLIYPELHRNQTLHEKRSKNKIIYYKTRK